MAVLNFVANDDKRRFAALFCKREDILNARIFVRRDIRRNALVICAGTQKIKFFSVNILNDYSFLPAKSNYPVDWAFALAVCNKYVFDFTTAFEQLKHSIPADYKAVVFSDISVFHV